MTSQRLTLSDGSVVWVDAVAGDVEEEVAFRRREAAFSDILPSVVTLCQDLGDALKSVAPHRTQVQFGVAFKAESTGLSALIAKAGVEANFMITLEWSRDHGPAREPESSAGGSAEDDEDA
ncbi:CU044_2847 family protein [Streptomyces sp. JNUCC 63]